MLHSKTGNISWWYLQCPKANGATISLSLPLKASQDVHSAMHGARVGVVTTPVGMPETLLFEAFVRYVDHVFTGSADAVVKSKVSTVFGSVREDHCCINVQVKDSSSAERVCTKALLKCMQPKALKGLYVSAAKHFGMPVTMKSADIQADFEYAVGQMNAAMSSITIGIIGTKKMSQEAFTELASKSAGSYVKPESVSSKRASTVIATVYNDCPIVKKEGWKRTIGSIFIKNAAKTNVYHTDKGLMLVDKRAYDEGQFKKAAGVFGDKFVKHPERKCAFVYSSMSKGCMSAVEAMEFLHKTLSAKDIADAAC